MRYFGYGAIIAALLSLTACGGKDAEDSKGNGSGNGNLLSRYEAAAAISNMVKKDEALAAVAADAAKAGDAAVVKKCLNSMNMITAKDNAAFAAAIALAKLDKGREAKEVALMISNTARQDEALAKIAKGG